MVYNKITDKVKRQDKTFYRIKDYEIKYCKIKDYKIGSVSMILETKHFGQIEIKEEDIISFPDGIPGFERLVKYIIIENPDEDVPFKWLQSVDDPDLAFVIINPFVFKQDYEFDMPQNAIEKLHIKSHQDIKIYTIVVVPEDIKNMTANLAAPIVINISNKKGKQVFLEDSRYHKRHLILEEMAKSTGANKQVPPETAEAAKVVEEDRTATGEGR